MFIRLRLWKKEAKNVISDLIWRSKS